MINESQLTKDQVETLGRPLDIWVSGLSWGSEPVHAIATDKWTEDDWEEFDMAEPDEKFDVIKWLSAKYGSPIYTLLDQS